MPAMKVRVIVNDLPGPAEEGGGQTVNHWLRIAAELVDELAPSLADSGIVVEPVVQVLGCFPGSAVLDAITDHIRDRDCVVLCANVIESLYRRLLDSIPDQPTDCDPSAHIQGILRDGLCRLSSASRAAFGVFVDVAGYGESSVGPSLQELWPGIFGTRRCETECRHVVSAARADDMVHPYWCPAGGPEAEPSQREYTMGWWHCGDAGHLRVG